MGISESMRLKFTTGKKHHLDDIDLAQDYGLTTRWHADVLLHSVYYLKAARSLRHGTGGKPQKVEF